MNIKNKFFNIAAVFKILFALGLVFVPLLVFAQTPTSAQSCAAFQAQFNITENGSTTNLVSGEPFYCTASALILVAINYLLAISGTVAILFLVVGGFWYLTSAGGEEQAEKGKKTIINSIIGLVVIILSYTIVRILSSLLTLGK